MSKRKGLGRGLDALLSSTENLPAVATDNPAATGANPTAPIAQPPEPGSGMRSVGIDLIDRSPYQPRTQFNPAALEELAASIRAQGVMQPLVVRPVPGGRFELIAGERRWRAAQAAGLERVPVAVREVGDQVAMAMALIENIQRQDLNPLEEARGFQRLQMEFELTHQKIAEMVGRSRVAVSNLLRLLDLQGEVAALLEQGQLDMGHARALLALEAAQQPGAARQVIEKALSVRQTEALVRQLQKPKVEKTAAVADDPNIRKLESDLSDRLGAVVAIQSGQAGRGRLDAEGHRFTGL